MAAEHTFVEKVESAVQPVLEGDGYELVMTEFIPRSHVLRLYIDRLGERDPDAPAVTLDDCTEVTHVVSDLLDAEGLSDLVEGHYTLEVSSPGLDRPLIRPHHFQRFMGRKAQVVAKKPPIPSSGRRKFTGTLLAADAQGIQIETDDEPLALGYDQIERARLVPEF